MLLKLEKDWDEYDMKMAQMNAKTINVFYCSLDVHKFNRISTYTLAKKNWKKLEITHEGTSQVKESKINLLVHKYEIFKIKKYESIFDIFFKFTNIINVLNGLSKTILTTNLCARF